MTFKTVGDNLAELGLLKRRNLICLTLAVLVYFGLYLTTGYAMDTPIAIGTTALITAIVAFGASLRLSTTDSFIAAAVVFIGMWGASVIVLFIHPEGPGNLFPIAIAIWGTVLAISTGVGWGTCPSAAVHAMGGGELVNWGLAYLKKWSGPSMPRLV